MLVVDPAGDPRRVAARRSDLYVALTRATQRLGVLHPDPLPAGLDPNRSIPGQRWLLQSHPAASARRR